MLRLKCLATLLVAGFAGASAQAQSQDSTLFSCSAGRSFQVEVRDHGRAVAVKTDAKTFILPKKVGSLGVRYSSQQATLIVDGEFAAFVAENAIDYSQCKATDAQAIPARLKVKGGRSE